MLQPDILVDAIGFEPTTPTMSSIIRTRTIPNRAKSFNPNGSKFHFAITLYLNAPKAQMSWLPNCQISYPFWAFICNFKSNVHTCYPFGTTSWSDQHLQLLYL